MGTMPTAALSASGHKGIFSAVTDDAQTARTTQNRHPFVFTGTKIQQDKENTKRKTVFLTSYRLSEKNIETVCRRIHKKIRAVRIMFLTARSLYFRYLHLETVNFLNSAQEPHR